MPFSAARALVVSLHDVSPRTQPVCARILAELGDAGVPRTSLLVIPNHHSQGHFAADAEFCGWLRQLEVQGHEVVTHGYFHRRRRKEDDAGWARLTTQFYTADEGEFFDLDRDSARALVAKANAELAEAGLHPRGFIAPAWLLSPAAEVALQELNVEYTTRLRTVTDLRTGQVWPSQSLVWSVRARWRRAMSRVWNATLFTLLRGAPLLRVSIHPVDVEHPAIWRQVRRLVRRALADREALTYHAWLQRVRASSPAATVQPPPP